MLAKSWSKTFALMLFLCAIAMAQDGEVVKVEVDLVTVNVFVSDGGKRPVPGLRAGDFRVMDGGRSVNLEFFDSHGPASIVFVIDTSDSMMHLKWKKLRQGLRRFLAQAREGNDYTLVAFGDRPSLVAQSVSAQDLWRSFNTLTPAGNTALYDAVLLGLDALGRSPRPLKALVLLSDGQDNRSRYRMSDVTREALARRATIYSVGILSNTYEFHKDERAGKDVMSELANSTGGVASFPNLEELRGVLEQINADVSHQYTLGYYAPDKTPGWRSIQVAVTPEPRRFRLRYQQRYLKK